MHWALIKLVQITIYANGELVCHLLISNYLLVHGDNNSWRKPRGIRNFRLVGLEDLFPLLDCAQPRGWRAALFIFPVFAASYFMAPHLWCHSPPRVSSTFISVQSFLLRGCHTNHEETIALCCQPFLMFSIVEYRYKGEDLSLARRQR